MPEEVPRATSLEALHADMVCCTRCELAQGRTQVVPGVGREGARILFIGEAPGKQEDVQGLPFVGNAGRLLNRLLADNGLDREDVYITNVVACRPPKNRAPRVREMKAHAPWLEQQIRLVGPELIVTLGRAALVYFLPTARITEVRGVPHTIERVGRQLTLLPLLHPAVAFRDPELKTALKQDFAKIPELLALVQRAA